MSRYDWPASAESRDDAGGRAAYVARYLPGPDVRMADGSIPPLPPMAAPRPRRRVAPKVLASGGANLWLPIGPSSIAHGQASGGPTVSGRVRDLAVEPTTGDRVYVATGSGGVWFSADRGASWQPLDEFVVSPNRSTMFPVGNALSCGAIHVHWGAAVTGADDIVTVGTGEPGGSGADLAGLPGGRVVGIGIMQAIGPGTGTPWSRPGGGDALRGHVVSRIVENPLSATHLFAATSDGVYSKVGAGAWTRLAGWVGGDAKDIAVTRVSATAIRLWVTTYATVHVAQVAHPPVAAPAVFTACVLPNSRSGLKVMAVGAGNDLWVQGQRTLPPDTAVAPGALWRVDAGAATPITATEITGIPAGLFGTSGDQSWYDNTLTVHPDHADTLFIGGSAAWTDNEWNAAVYRVTITGTTAAAVFVGHGVHSDVHIIRVGGPTLPPGPDRTVWVGCDGGVFMSGADGRADSFVTRNNALATLEPGFVACHPTNDGIVVAGMQDNGTCERVGDTVWSEPFPGDGGGVVYDPANPSRFFRQYIKASWDSSDHGSIPPVKRRVGTVKNSSEAFEDGQSLFYSGAAALNHGGTTHLVIGTNRPWYSPDWGRSWVTIPSGRDPRATNTADLALDVVNPGTVDGRYTDSVPTFLCCTSDYSGDRLNGTGIVVCRLSVMLDDGTDHRIRLLVLWNGGISLFVGRRPAASTSPTAPAWTWVTEVTEPIRSATAGAEATAVTNGTPVAFLPGVDLISDLAVHDATRGAHGSFYVTTVGAPTSGAGTVIDTLWWYDGDGHFVPCGVRRNAPHTSWTVAADRAVSPALSVVVDPAHREIVYVGTSVGVVRGTLSLPAGQPTWVWERFDNGMPEAAVQDMSIYDHDGVRLLRAALQARGIWEVDLQTVVATPRTFLRVHATDTRRRLPTPLDGPATSGSNGLRYDSSPDIVLDTSALSFSTIGPSEEELVEPLAPLTIGQHVAQQFTATSFKAHVLVHHRWFAAATTAQVKVALLRHAIPAAGGDVPLGGIWAALVAIAGGGAVPGVLPDDWEKAGATLVRSVGAPVDTRQPRAVSFDINLSSLDEGAQVMFMAVVMSGTDQITAADAVKPDTTACVNVRELVLNSRHVAARSFRLGD
jgi:hypothetical protein